MTTVTSDPPESEEIEFAQGGDVPTQNMRVTYENLDPERPTSRFPRIYKTMGNGVITKMWLTPAEGLWLAQELTRMFTP